MTNLSGANLNNGAAVGPQGEGRESPSTFPKYPAYKDSRVDWLGEIPEGWSIKPLWALFRRHKLTGFPDEQLLSVYRDYGVIPKASRDDNFNKPSDDLGAYQLVQVGDLAINKMKAWQGSVGISSHKGIVSPAYHVYAPSHSEAPQYLHHLFRCNEYIAGYLANSKGIRVNQWDLEPQQHSRMSVLLPSFQEQTQIARFLDHETARIDALIEEQQRLIELLKEKRQAVISHAVTKGLDPTVPMKDSGVEWLGEVPAHWTVAPIKFFFEFLDGQRIPIKAEDRGAMQGDYPYYGASGIIDYVNDFIFEEDLVLVSEDGANLLMRSTPIAFVAQGKYWVNNHAHIIRPQDESLTYWAEVIEQQDLTNYVTGSAQPKLTAEALGSIKIAVPPTGSERAAIQAFILEIDAELGALLSEAACGVRLLQERRSALISAAVTGKIDVRGWQPPASTQAPELAVAEAN